MATFKNWISGALAHGQINQAELARLMSDELGKPIDRSIINKMVLGTRDISAEEMLAISKITGFDVPSRQSTSAKMIPVVGFVGAGQEIYAIDDHEKGAGLDEVEMPYFGMHPSTVAVRVRGDSMEPACYEGDLIFYDNRESGDLTHLIGKECVVSLTDGRKFVKILQRHGNGDWYLWSNNSKPIDGIRIEWAARVKLIQRR